MSVHKLPEGQTLIDGLSALGKALGYHVQPELKVQRTGRSQPAVDVAWLSEKEHLYPLMIFEVESRASNAAANNPTKVFGQSNRGFERPLFFFHVFASSGSDTGRIAALEGVFGTHNYRTYRIDQSGTTELLVDVLAQHRRLHRNLALSSFLDALQHEAWRSADRDALLRRTEELRFSANHLREYAFGSSYDASLLQHFRRLLVLTLTLPEPERLSFEYGTYLGAHWATPIHLGVLALDHTHGSYAFAQLRSWQEASSYMTQIGPHFGLSRDYDEFVLGFAPAMWALVAALMHRIEGAAEYICKQGWAILEHLEKESLELTFFTAVWMLHISAAAGMRDNFELLRTYINNRGGIGSGFLFKPPSMGSEEEYQGGDSSFSPVQENQELVPEFRDFLARARVARDVAIVDRQNKDDQSLLRLVAWSLSDNKAIYSWADVIMAHLYKD